METDYQIYSSVLGKLLSEADKEGRKTRTFVYGAGGQLVATQNIDWNAPSAVRQTVNWEYWDAGGASRMVAAHGGGGLYYSGIYGQAELDPEGSNVGTANPNGTGGAGGGQPDLSQSPGGWGYGSFGDPFGSYSCRVNGFDAPCSLAFRMLSNGSADIDSLHTSDSTLRELNIFAQPVYSYRDTNRPHEPEDPDKIVIYKDIERYLSGYTYWIPGVITGDPDKEYIDDDYLDFIEPFLEKNINKDSCKTFIQSLAGNVNLTDLFKKVRKQGGVYLAPRKDYDGEAAFAIGNFEEETAGIEFNTNPNPFPAKSLLKSVIQTRVNVLTIIHELLHLITKLNDGQLSQKLHKEGVIIAPPPPILAKNPRPTTKEIVAWRNANSSYWNSALSNNCLPDVEEFRGWWIDIVNNP